MFDMASHPLVRNFRPRPFDCGSVVNLPRLTGRQKMEADALNFADRMNRRAHGNQCSATTGMWEELMFVNSADYTAFNTSSSEGSLLAGGNNEQPVLPALFFFNKQGRQRTIRLTVAGVIGLDIDADDVTFPGSSCLRHHVGIVVPVGGVYRGDGGDHDGVWRVEHRWWKLEARSTRSTRRASAPATPRSPGPWLHVTSPGGFASPFIYPLEITTPDTATWTQTFDNSVTQVRQSVGHVQRQQFQQHGDLQAVAVGRHGN